MAENSDGAEGAVDEGGGIPRVGAAKSAGIEAPRRGDMVRALSHQNPSGNNEVASRIDTSVENTVNSANDGQEKRYRDTRGAAAIAVKSTTTPTSGQKSLLAHNQRQNPPKKSSSTPDPVAYAEETNSMQDKPFNSLLRARLEQVAPLDRM